MTRMTGILLLLSTLLLWGCVRTPVRGDPDQPSPLQGWVRGELAPYLAQQLGQHPRFKGEPVMLVRLSGPDLQPEIDELTAAVRDQLRDRLLQAPGVRLQWQPHRPRPQHHKRLQRPQCGDSGAARYFVGIEITALADGRFRVAVRALDWLAREWVSGFGRSWSGQLTSSEQQQRQRSQADESLRGLRVLPFENGQTDLAAAYLAGNLSCLLAQQASEGLVLYPEPPPADQPQISTLLQLIGPNLSRLRQVRVTDNRKEANILLRGEAHPIAPGLYQLWVALHPAGSGEHLAGVDTAVYLHLPPASADARPLMTSRRIQAVPPSDDTTPILVPQVRIGCGDEQDRQDGACNSLRVDVTGAQQLFLLALDSEAGLVRAFPGRCPQKRLPGGVGDAHRRYLFSNPGLAGPGTFYGIAVSDTKLARRLTRLLARLPDGCSDSETTHQPNADLDRWLQELQRLMNDHPGHLAWQAWRYPASW